MPDIKSLQCALIIAELLPFQNLPFKDRSDEWWDGFWNVMGLKEAKRIRRQYEN